MSNLTLVKVLSDYYEKNLMPNILFKDMIERDGIKILKDDESFYNPIYSDLDDFDKRHDSSITPPIYLNDFDFNIEEDREQILALLRTEYEGNNFDTVASCSCGKYRSNMYINSNFSCDSCGTHVTKPLVNKIETKVWLKRPYNVKGFLLPAMYATFFTKLNTKTPKVNIVEYWINEDVRKEKRFKDIHNNSGKMAKRIDMFRESLGIEFGYNSFIENIDKIITSLLVHDYYKLLDVKEQERLHFLEFWEKYKDRAVSKYFPLPNKIITIVETDNRNKYYTKEQMELNSIFQTLADLYRDHDIRSESNEALTGKMYNKLVKSLEDVQKNLLFGKKGLIRYHSGAGKLPFTGRSIITGESGVCRSDTIVVPWVFGLTCLDKHLTNWLYNKGYAPLEVKEIIRKAAYNHCPIIEEFFNWIETNRYAMCMGGRNPSIQYLSARAFFVKFNRDLDDKSIRIPITTVGEFNADFDGDQIYLYFLPDLAAKLESYSSWGHHQMLDPNKYARVSRFCSQTKTNLLNINSINLNTEILEE